MEVAGPAGPLTVERAWRTVFLASPAGDYVSGQTIFVDGGRTAT